MKSMEHTTLSTELRIRLAVRPPPRKGLLHKGVSGDEAPIREPCGI